MESQKPILYLNADAMPTKYSVADDVKSLAKSSTNGSIAGAVVGFIYSVYSGKNKLLYAAIGAIGGGILGYVFNKIV